jgi:5-epi-alpha-selinene synthase
MSEKIIIPDLFCPIESVMNEFTDMAEKNSLRWAQEFGLVPPDRQEYQVLKAAKTASLFGFTNPNASLDELILMTNWVVWFFLLDDLCDTTDLGKDPRRLSFLHSKLLNMLNGAKMTNQDEPLVHALHDIHRRLTKKTSVLWVQRFIYDVEQQFQGYMWEVENRLNGIKPNLLMYIKLRPYTLVSTPCCDLTFIAKKIPPDANFLKHIYVQQLTAMVGNYVGWANDIYSFNRDLREGTPHNLVLILQREYGITLQDAINRAVEMCNAEMNNFLDLESRLPSFGEAEDVHIKSYVEGLRNWLSGGLDWHLKTERYLS